ncbi:hypothetical protein D3C77_294160 [compost metagenome]
MPGQLQAVLAAIVERPALPLAQHALVQKGIRPGQRQLQRPGRQVQAQPLPLGGVHAPVAQARPRRLLRQQPDLGEHLRGGPASTPGDVAHQTQHSGIEHVVMGLVLELAHMQYRLGVRIVQGDQHTVGHPRQVTDETLEAGTHRGGRVQQNIQALQGTGGHARHQLTTKGRTGTRDLALKQQLLDLQRRYLAIFVEPGRVDTGPLQQLFDRQAKALGMGNQGVGKGTGDKGTSKHGMSQK